MVGGDGEQVLSLSEAEEPESSPLRLDLSNGSVDLLPSLGALQESQPDETSIPDSTSEDFRFIFQSQWWLPLKIMGPVDVGRTRTDVDIDLGTLLDDLRFVVEGGFEYTNDQWSFLAWGLYLNVGTDVETTVPGSGDPDLPRGPFTLDTDMDFKMTLVDLALAYRVGDWSLGSSETATWGLDVTAGMQFWFTDLQVSERFPGGFDPGIDEQDQWGDLTVGGRVVFNCSDQLNASVRGQVGGFDISSSSKLTWYVQAVGEYKLTPQIGLVAGYRYLDLDWEQGSGPSKIAYDWEIHGPIIGVNIHF